MTAGDALGLLVRGLVVGFAIAAPVGPIGVLCIRRTLAGGWASGLASGLGAATADALYAGVAGFGLTAVSALLVGQQGWLRGIGGAFLCYLGWRAFMAATPVPVAASAGRGAGAVRRASLGAWASALGLTIANPATILSFAAVFAALGDLGTRGRPALAAVLVLGVFLGSALWWLALSTAAALLRERLGAAGLAWATRVSGVVLAGFGVAALVWALWPGPP